MGQSDTRYIGLELKGESNAYLEMISSGGRQGRATNLLVLLADEAFLTISMAKEGDRVGTSSDRTHHCCSITGQSLFRDWSWAEWLPRESAGGDRRLHMAPPWRSP